MIALYLRTRISIWTMTSWVLCAAAMVFAGFNGVALPSFVTATLQTTPFAVISALLLGVLLVGGLGSGDPRIEATSTRPLAVLDLAILALPVIALAAIGTLTTAPSAVVVTVRTLGGFIGLGMIAAAIGGRIAGTASQVVLFILATLLGQTKTGAVQIWAFPIAPASSLSAAVAALLLILGGGLTWLFMSDERRIRATT